MSTAVVSPELVASALGAIDDANAADPTRHDGTPRAQFEGQRGSKWLSRLDETPTGALQIAVRAHHLRRWEVERSQYPEGRQGYLRWRRDNKAHQRDQAAQLLTDVGCDAATVEEVGRLLLRRGLGSDRDTQALEDVACLVFLETRFEGLVDRLDHGHAVGVVRKTLGKMSTRAIELAGLVPLSPPASAVLTEAILGRPPQEPNEDRS